MPFFEKEKRFERKESSAPIATSLKERKMTMDRNAQSLVVSQLRSLHVNRAGNDENDLERRSERRTEQVT